MKQNKKKNLVTLTLIMCTLVFFASTYTSLAATYENKKTFESVVLPDVSSNTTFKEGTKTTNRKYGKVKMSSYSNCDAVDCWMRTYVNGSWHYWTPYILSNISDKLEHKIKYCDADSAYYKKGVKAQLRGENADSYYSIYDCKVSGSVWFN